jgi:hypothetical protein
MPRLRVRVRNSQYDRRHRYGYHIEEFNEYEGEVIPNPKWVKDDSFCLTTGDSQFPFRVIDKENIIHGWYWAEGKGTKAGELNVIAAGVNVGRSNLTKVVDGSNGKKYVLTKSGNRWSCNCTGFSYRKTCSHVKDA